MKLAVTKTTDLSMTDIAGLDPLTVFLENFAPGRGGITIKCAGKSWSTGWGAMGGRTVEQFFVSCDDDYLIGCLSSIRPDIAVTDSDKLEPWLRGEIVKMRRAKDLKKDTARDYWNDAACIVITSSWCSHSELMEAVIGDDWWHFLPTVENPEFTYLTRIVRTVREGLREYLFMATEPG